MVRKNEDKIERFSELVEAFCYNPRIGSYMIFERDYSNNPTEGIDLRFITLNKNTGEFYSEDYQST